MMRKIITISVLLIALCFAQTDTFYVYQDMKVNGSVRTIGGVLPYADSLWDCGDSLAYWKAIYAYYGIFKILGLNCADSGKIDTSYMEDVWLDSIHSCSSVINIDADTVFLDGNGNDAKFVQFCELLDVANTENAFLCSTITGTGTDANIRRAMKSVLIDGGWRAASQTYAGYFFNNAYGNRSYGLLGYSAFDSVVGQKFGVKGLVENLGDANVGVFGQSTDNTNQGGDNIGVLGVAYNPYLITATNYEVGGYFALLPAGSIPPTYNCRSALVANNGAEGTNNDYIMVGQDNYFNVFEVVDEGDSAGAVYVIDKTPDTTIIRPRIVISDSADIGIGLFDTLYSIKGLFVFGNDSIKLFKTPMLGGKGNGLEVVLNSDLDYAIVGQTDGDIAIYGRCDDSIAVYAESDNWIGLKATADHAFGVYAWAVDSFGGYFNVTAGVYGVWGTASNKYGVVCNSASIPLWAGFGTVGATSDTVVQFGAGGFPSRKAWIDSLGSYIIIGGSQLRATAVEADSGIFTVITATTLVIDSIDADHGVFNISLWADSIYSVHLVNTTSGLFQGYVDADSVHADHIVSDNQVSADSVHGVHGVFTVHINTDSIYSVHLVNTTSGLFQGYVDADSLHGDHIVADNQVVGDSLYGDHVVANVELIADSVNAVHGVFTVHVNTDSIYCEHLVNNVSGVFNAYVTCDSIEADHGYFQVHVNTDSIYCEHIVNNTSGLFNAYVDADSVHGDHIVSDNQVVGDSLYGDHVVANVELIADSVNAVHGVFSVHVNADSIYCEHLVNNTNAITGALTVNGTITSTSITRGQATFTRNTLVDTVPGITGVSTNSFIVVTGKNTPALTSGLTWTYLAAESILVHILEGDTTGQAVTYCWIRLE